MLDAKKNALISRNITINKKRTSIRLEAQMWIALKDIAKREKCTVHQICTLIADKKAQNITLTAAIRIFLILYYKSAATEDGHRKAGHGGLQQMLARVASKQAEKLSYDDNAGPALQRGLVCQT